MTNFKQLQLRLKRLDLQRLTAPQIPPLVICALAPDGQPHVIAVYSSHQEPSGQYVGPASSLRPMDGTRARWIWRVREDDRSVLF